MKHSIVVKFIAVALCAAFLLSAVGSGVGALCLTEMGLYEQTVDELYDESRTTLAEVFASQIATNYASQTLGGCPEGMTDNYVHFNAGYYGYTLKDAEGNVLKEQELENPADGTREYTFTVQESYMKLLEAIPDSQMYEATVPPSYDDLYIIDNIPEDDVLVDEIFFYTNEGFDSSYGGEPLGILYHTTTGDVIFQAHDPNVRLRSGEPITQASFFSNGELIYQVTCSDGVGAFAVDDNGLLSVVFQNPESTEATIPAAPFESDYLYNAIPYEGVEVQSVSFSYIGIDEIKPGSETHGSGEVLGKLFTNDDGTVTFVSREPRSFSPTWGTVSYAAFYGTDGEVLYETYCRGGAGSVFETSDGYVNFESWLEHYDVSNSATEPQTENPTEAPAQAPFAALSYSLTNNIPAEGAYVHSVSFTDSNGPSSFGICTVTLDTRTGFLSYNADGAVIFRTTSPSPIRPDGDTFYYIAFYDADNEVLYEARSPEGVGTFYLDEDNYLYFTSTMETNHTPTAEFPPVSTTVPMAEEPTEPYTEPYTEPTTIPDTTTATEVVQTPVDMPQETTIIAELTDPTEAPDYSDDEITGMLYYDHELGEHVHANFVYEDMPESYTVELLLAPGAYEMDAVYDLLNWVWFHRNELLYVLGVGLFGFAVTAVYLCCAAGKKKGREEVRAGGFNCLSLDVYLGVGILAICGLAVLGFEGGYYLLRYSPQILAPFAVIMGYAAALIIVGFCFACAAQFKTPGGYWWRNTLTVRCAKLAIQFLRWSVKLFFRFMGWLERFLGRTFPMIGKTIVFCWNTFIDLCIKVYRYTEKGLTRLGRGLGKIAQRTYAWLHAFLSLLPVTWQWLLIGLFLLFILFLSILTRSEGWIVFGCLAGIALVIYGSHCFGLLLDSTKRMSKGDLETKVDDKLMVGSFKEFAGDLNSLADVAVVAAQKQMASDRMKTELITNVSHDIKTPLTSIINYVDLLQKPHTDEEQEVYLEVLSRQSQRMKKLLEDLIEMSKASTGNMTVHITKINAVEAVNQALGEFADKLEKAQLIPMVQQPENPVYMQADGRLAWRVLSNILSNAVKYALPGTRVYIDVMEMDNKVLISLKNISREALNVSAEELMERFVRGDASRNTEGSGLGLNIAQSLMEIQKGKLQLTVDGDLFKVTLIFPGAEE